MRAGITALILFVACLTSFSQKQAAFWVNGFGSFDFNTYPPKSIPIGSGSNIENMRASVADSLGNLLFFTDGLSYFDRNGVSMPHGASVLQPTWGSTGIPLVIAPFPKNPSKYLAFVVGLPQSNACCNSDRKLRYSVIDMNLNNGKGDVIERNTEIAPFQRTEFTLIKAAGDTEGFWLITIADFPDNRRLMAYRVTATGVSPTPVLTNIGGYLAQTQVLKASPDGRYLVIGVDPDDGTNKLRVLRFNSNTGTFSFFRELTAHARSKIGSYPQYDVKFGIPEFSPDSRFIYMTRDSLNLPSPNQYSSYNKLLCYDLNTTSTAQFESSKQILHSFDPVSYPATAFLQLTPQGKIIVMDFQTGGYMHTIHHPEACSVAGKMFEYRSIAVGANILFFSTPQFPAWYFYTPAVVAVGNSFAGKDVTICPNEIALLGKEPLAGYSYQWLETGLSNNNLSNPSYQGTGNATGVNDTLHFDLKVTDMEGCQYFDSVSVVTKGVNRWTIEGSKSVCPGAPDVAYQTTNSWHGKTLTWNIDGGILVGSNGNDTVSVHWGASNLSASVSAVSANPNGCNDKIEPFPVKVFKYLDTEKPNGRDSLLCGQNLEPYQIAGTNGSTYQWETINGNVTSGQGSNQVSVQWDPTAYRSSVWINESVNTELETCFGRSDTLHVTNPRNIPGPNVLLNTISVDQSDNKTLEVYYQIKNPRFYKNYVQLLSRQPSAPGWTSAGFLDRKETTATFCCFPLDEKMIEFRLVAFNLCGDSASSTIHRNILLQAEALEDENYVQLSWNPYQAWKEGVKKYTVYRNLDDAKIDNGLNMSNAGNTADVRYRYEKITDAFKHRIRVVAEPVSAQLMPSFSNEVMLEFKNELIFPNVITPNGDALNDTWKPHPLELYSDNDLIIFNRWGQQVYHKKKYDGGWDADGISEGVYFYEFRSPRIGSKRGYIQIMR